MSTEHFHLLNLGTMYENVEEHAHEYYIPTLALQS